ncbi:hypothetical protein Tco_1415112 [Tanacetum coccineum]
MSDSEDSTVTYTAVSSPYEDSSDMGSPGVEGPPMMPEDPHAYVVAIFQAPPSPDYVPGPEEPEQAPPSPVYLPYVPEPVYPEYMPPEDDVLPAEEQPLPTAASPTTDLSGYIPESDPEEDDEEDPEEDPANYPADRGDDGDDDDDVNEDEEDKDEEFIALPTLPLSPLSPYSSPLPQIPSLPLPIQSPPPNIPTYIEAPIHENEIPEICLPLRKRPCHTAPTPRYEARESSAAGAARQDVPAVAKADLYRFVDMVDAAPERLMSSELGYGITDTWDDLEDGIMYSLLEDAREDRSLLRGRVNMLFRDRPYHRRTALLMETTVIAQQSEITELWVADRRRHAVITEAQMTEFQRQQGPANGPAQPEVPEEAGSSF